MIDRRQSGICAPTRTCFQHKYGALEVNPSWASTEYAHVPSRPFSAVYVADSEIRPASGSVNEMPVATHGSSGGVSAFAPEQADKNEAHTMESSRYFIEGQSST